ncbi:hypothetical protein B296_00026018, partial [Ensete ventricosum]
FVSLYDRDGVELVGLDYAARQLGVERRRIYDIVNVMESVGVRSGPWVLYFLCSSVGFDFTRIGFGAPDLVNIFELLAFFLCTSASCVLGSTRLDSVLDIELDFFFLHDSSFIASPATDNRKDKSLGLLTRNFVKLFLTSDVISVTCCITLWFRFFTSVDTISLDEAARLLLGDISDLSNMRSICQPHFILFSSIQVEARKPAFRWLGTEGKPKTDTGGTLAPPPTVKPLNKRAFGTEITNVDVKRSRLCCTVSKKPGKAQMRSDDLKECNLTAQKQLNTKSGYVFGPFCPAGMTKVDDDVEGKGGRSTQDWESLASSLRPQYHNQGLVHVPRCL